MIFCPFFGTPCTSRAVLKEIYLRAGHCTFKHLPLKVDMLISEKFKPYFGHFHCKSNIPDESALQLLATISNLSIVKRRSDFQNWIHFDHSKELFVQSLIPQERRNASTCFVWTTSAEATDLNIHCNGKRAASMNWWLTHSALKWGLNWVVPLIWVWKKNYFLFFRSSIQIG